MEPNRCALRRSLLQHFEQNKGKAEKRLMCGASLT
jgi:hypothetical protein